MNSKRRLPTNLLQLLSICLILVYSFIVQAQSSESKVVERNPSIQIAGLVSYSIEQLEVRGTLTLDGKVYSLVRTPEMTIHLVQIGDIIGDEVVVEILEFDLKIMPKGSDTANKARKVREKLGDDCGNTPNPPSYGLCKPWPLGDYPFWPSP